MSDQDAQVTISGVGVQATVTVPAGASLDVALEQADVSPDRDGLKVAVNGESVADPSSVQVENGDQVVATPQNAKLG